VGRARSEEMAACTTTSGRSSAPALTALYLDAFRTRAPEPPEPRDRHALSNAAMAPLRGPDGRGRPYPRRRTVGGAIMLSSRRSAGT
jgi:hypothetical protein